LEEVTKHYTGKRGFFKNLRTRMAWYLDRPLRNRRDLAYLLTLMHLDGKGVEIGVAKGEFSVVLLENSRLSILYSVDPWREYSEDQYDDLNNVAQQINEHRYRSVVEYFKKYGQRSQILRKTSREASRTIDDNSLDFVYIDANHSYKACKEDIELWWPKLKSGGLFAGHDYLDGHLPDGDFGVKSAVDEFVAKNHLRLYVIHQEWPSWYVIKH